MKRPFRRSALWGLALLAVWIGGSPSTRNADAWIAGQDPYASARELESLELQAKQLDELVSNRIGRGEAVSDEAGQELTEIFGKLASFREIQRRHANAGREGTGVPKADAEGLADRIAALRLELRAGEAGAAEPARPNAEPSAQPAEGEPTEADEADIAAAPAPVYIPEGTKVIIETKAWLSSRDAEVGDRFEATVAQSAVVDGRVVVPEGAGFQGYVAEVKPARRASRGGELLLVVDRMRVAEGQTTAVRATVVEAAYGEDLEGDDVDTGKVVTRSILGAIIGGLIGGGKGALIGIGIASGGTLLAEKGEEVELPPGTQLRVRFESSVTATWGVAPGQQQLPQREQR